MQQALERERYRERERERDRERERGRARERAATRALVVVGGVVTAQGHAGNGAAQSGPVEAADAATVGSVLVKSRLRGRDAFAPAREPGPPRGQNPIGFRRFSSDMASAAVSLPTIDHHYQFCVVGFVKKRAIVLADDPLAKCASELANDSSILFQERLRPPSRAKTA